MPDYVQVPPARLAPETLDALLEEYASRDGTDYGAVELTLAQKTGNLRRQLEGGELHLVYDTESETWDLVDAQRARQLLQDD